MTAPRHARLRRWAWLASLTLVALAAACNALNGDHDRFLDSPDSGGVKKGDAAGDLPDVSDEKPPVLMEGGDEDGGVRMFNVPLQFTTPNDASFVTTGAGTEITGYGTNANHPIIIVNPAADFGSDDYTLYAVIKLPQDGEFGLILRWQPGTNMGHVFGSEFGGNHKPFIGVIGAPDWNPSDDVNSTTSWNFDAGARYNLVVRAAGPMISGKLWNAGVPEPAGFQVVVAQAQLTTGRGIGYYTYFTNGEVLESLRVSIP